MNRMRLRVADEGFPHLPVAVDVIISAGCVHKVGVVHAVCVHGLTPGCQPFRDPWSLTAASDIKGSQSRCIHQKQQAGLPQSVYDSLCYQLL